MLVLLLSGCEVGEQRTVALAPTDEPPAATATVSAAEPVATATPRPATPTRLPATATPASPTPVSPTPISPTPVPPSRTPTLTATLVPTEGPDASVALAAVAQEVAVELNRRRSENGCLVPLTLVPELSLAAQTHSLDLATRDTLDHLGADGSNPGQRIQQAGYQWANGGQGVHVWAENVAAGYPTPVEVVQGWIDSAGHRENILNCDFRELGVGFAQRENTVYRYYWTTVFTIGRA